MGLGEGAGEGYREGFLEGFQGDGARVGVVGHLITHLILTHMAQGLQQDSSPRHPNPSSVKVQFPPEGLAETIREEGLSIQALSPKAPP